MGPSSTLMPAPFITEMSSSFLALMSCSRAQGPPLAWHIPVLDSLQENMHDLLPDISSGSSRVRLLSHTPHQEATEDLCAWLTARQLLPLRGTQPP